LIQVNIPVVRNLIHYLVGIDAPSSGSGSRPVDRNCSAIIVRKSATDW